MTGQGIVKAPFVENKEWFQTLIAKPSVDKLEKFNTFKNTQWASSETVGKESFSKSKYDSTYGLSEDAAHHIHHIHHIGAIVSVFIFLFGTILAYLMYVKKSLDPSVWINRFNGWYRALQNKYYFDDFYVGKMIQKGLVPFNNLLARFDMGFYDRYAIDGWEKVNKVLYTISSKFDNLIIDRSMVDGTGTSVRLFNVILRTIQNGKIQFYFVIAIVVLVSYFYSLGLNKF